MPVFEGMIVEDSATEGDLETIVVGPEVVVATDERNAATQIGINNPDITIDPSRMRVIVRDF